MRLAAVTALCLSLAACREPSPLRVGTYNIRNFGREPTDVDRLARVILDARPDVLALQEIIDPAAVEALEGRLLALGGARYRHALARCGGRRGLLVGYLYSARVSRVRIEEFPSLEPGGACEGDDRAGLVGVFRAGSVELSALTLHLAAGSEPERVERRRAQWDRALAIAERLRHAGAARVIVLGDANSTGWLDDRGGERAFITERARRAGLAVATANVACTEFWRAPSKRFEASVLDHILSAPGIVSNAMVHGYCARLACTAHDEPTAEYATVSDHCPVTVDLAP